MRVTGKLHTMRKPQEFSVLTMSDGRVMVQSDKSIGVINPDTGDGQLSVKGNTFMHLSLNGFTYAFPAEFVQACLSVIERQGATTDLGGVIQINTGKVIGGNSDSGQ